MSRLGTPAVRHTPNLSPQSQHRSWILNLLSRKLLCYDNKYVNGYLLMLRLTLSFACSAILHHYLRNTAMALIRNRSKRDPTVFAFRHQHVVATGRVWPIINPFVGRLSPTRVWLSSHLRDTFQAYRPIEDRQNPIVHCDDLWLFYAKCDAWAQRSPHGASSSSLCHSSRWIAITLLCLHSRLM